MKLGAVMFITLMITTERQCVFSFQNLERQTSWNDDLSIPCFSTISPRGTGKERPMSQFTMSAAMRSIGTIRPESSLFLLCDIQERFRSIIWQSHTVINTAKYLVEASRILNIPVIATEQYPKALGHTCAEIPILAPEPAEGQEPGQNIPVYEKKLFSMMTEEVTQHVSSIENLRSIILFGQETHVCVQQTCLDLLDSGYDVHIVVDACSSQRPLDREIAFERMKQSGAFLTTAESAVFMLMKTAEHSALRQISSLTKDHFKLPNGFQNPIQSNASAPVSEEKLSTV